MQRDNLTYRMVCSESKELRILGMISAVWMARSIYYAVKHGIFNMIANDTAQVDAIAARIHVVPESLQGLLKGLEHLELLVEETTGCFALTELGATLLPNARGRLADMTILWGEEFHRAWSALPEAMATATTGFEVAHAEPLFAYLSTQPAVAARFDRAMHGLGELLYPELARLLDWSAYSHVLDVGGGSGFLLATLLHAHSHLHGTLFDLPHVIEQARTLNNHAVLENRLEYCAGDFFQALPDGADCIILSNIIHDWDDERAAQILRNCRAVMAGGTCLVLVEMALDHVQEPLLARSTDLNMLMLTGGKERSIHSFNRLLMQAGFALDAVYNIQNLTCALLARPQSST